MQVNNQNDVVLVRRDHSVAILTLNNSQRRNAFSLQMRQTYWQQLNELMHHDPTCRAIVLTGANNTFCAGGDISEMKERTVIENRERNLLLLNIFRLMVAGPKPIVAAVEGVAMGAGLSLAAACDYVVTSSTARYACAFLKVGLLPDMGLYWSLAQRVGAGKARELLLTAKEFNGEEAKRVALVNQLVAPGDTLEAALAVARHYAAMPPLATAHLKAVLAAGTNTLDDAIESEINLQPIMYHSLDHHEAIKAISEHRKPMFMGN